MAKKKINRFICMLTGGHKYKPWETKIQHQIDGLYSITSKCCRCGYIRQDLVPLDVPEWNDRIKEVKEYDGKAISN